MHASWNPADIEAIFYFNDSSRRSRASQAVHSYHAARRVQRWFEAARDIMAPGSKERPFEQNKAVMPIVQLRAPNAECHDALAVERRVLTHAGGTLAGDVAGAFVDGGP